MNTQKPFLSASQRGFHLVQPTDEHIIKQLMGSKHDKVHPFPSDTNEFIQRRLGTTEQTRQTWVKLDDDNQITAALYSARFIRPIPHPSVLAGNVGKILHANSILVENVKPSSFIFYSISSFNGGAGRNLISNVHEHLSEICPNIWLSTLSPLRAPAPPPNAKKDIPPEKRNFSDWLRKNVTPEIDNLRNDKSVLKALALKYLAENIHIVQRFHMGNGAYIGDIKFGCNTPDSADYNDGMNMMVNYVYPSKQKRTELQSAFKGGQLSLAPHLLQAGLSSQRRNVFGQFNP